MTQTQKEEKIINLLTMYSTAFPTARIGKTGLSLYAKSLIHVSLSLIGAALKKHLQTCKFFPTVAEIIEQAESLACTAADTVIKTPGEAWAEVVQELTQNFIYKEPQFSSPQIHRAARYMGWNALCMLSVDEVNEARSQFMKIYQSVLDQEKQTQRNRMILDNLPHREIQTFAQSSASDTDRQENPEKQKKFIVLAVKNQDVNIAGSNTPPYDIAPAGSIQESNLQSDLQGDE